MTARSPTPTLVVFTLGADADCNRRPLLPGSLRPLEAQLRHNCLESVLAAGREIGCRLVVSTPSELDMADDVERLQQSGSGFGERFANTLNRVGRSTDGPVLVVGADSPGLTAEHLQSALDRLEGAPEDVVLGPCPDGGFYLLAISDALEFDPGTIRWCHRSTLRTLRSSLASAGRSIHLLSDLVDLDRRRDLEVWLSGRLSAAWRHLTRALLRAMASFHRRLPSSDETWRRTAFVPIPVHRPPPVALLRQD